MGRPPSAKKDLRALRRRQVMIYRLLVLAVLAAVLLARFAGCPGPRTTTQPDAGDADYAVYNGKTVTAVKVLDGDTLDVNIPDAKARKRQAYTRIRLWGIDTPEISHFGKPAMYFGYEAAEFARKLLAGKKVRLELLEDETRDRFGRLLAYVYLPDGRLYNALAIAEGYAYAETRFDHPRKKEFVALEAQARNASRGLWSNLTPDQLPSWYKPYRLNEFWRSRGLKPAPPPAKSPSKRQKRSMPKPGVSGD